MNGRKVNVYNNNEYKRICFFVFSIPDVVGSIGILALQYSSCLNIARAQKCGGVHKKIIPKSIIGSKVKFPVAQINPIIGGIAQAAPPITIF